VAEDKRLHPLLGFTRHFDRILAGAHEVAQRLIAFVGHVDRAEFAGAVETRQRHRVPAIGLHTVARPFRGHRGTHHRAVLAQRPEVAEDREATGASFVHDVQRAPGRAQGTQHLIERLELTPDGSILPDLPESAALG